MPKESLVRAWELGRAYGRQEVLSAWQWQRADQDTATPDEAAGVSYLHQFRAKRAAADQANRVASDR